MMDVIDLTSTEAHSDALIAFYNELYLSSFPDDDERESLQNIQRQLKTAGDSSSKRHTYHICLMTFDGEIVGGSISGYFAIPNSAVIEFILIKEGFRNNRLGRHLLNHTQEVLQQDALRLNGSSLSYIFAEVDDPSLFLTTPANTNGLQRIAIWNSWGFEMLDFSYHQPALACDKKAISYLRIFCKQFRPESGSTISSQTLLSFISEYFIWAFGIPDPDANVQYQKMAQSLDRISTVEVLRSPPKAKS